MLVMAPISPRIAERFGNKPSVAGGMTIAAVTMFYFSKTTADSGYGTILVALVFMAVGMFLAMVPATNSIMSSLPPGKAGVGSAMNDTTRQVGGALGVAVLGSILTSSYRSTIGSSLSALPANALTTAKSSVGGAIAVGNAVGGSQGDAITKVAKDAFVHGMSHGLEVGAAFILVSAIVSLVWLPNRVIPAEEPESPAAVSKLEEDDVSPA
jgi:MFS family permease